jgi:manganese/zinc/iron transport system permease protein
MHSLHLWAMATAATVAAACALVGTLLVVRRMSLLGDAIGHAVLPGIAVAVLAGGRPGGPLVFAGAVAAALLTVWLTRALKSAAGLADDAGAGVVFTALFALGIVIVSTAGARRDLDASCVLHGILELVPFDTIRLMGVDAPRGLVSAAAVLALVTAGLAASWKLQVFTAFDADAARAAGLPVAAVTGSLLAATAVVAVSGFEVVGAVLVVALLVVPAAAAELLVRRLHHVAVVAVGLAVAGSILGYLAAWRWNTSAAGAIAVALGLEYLLAVIVAPEDGLVARAVARIRYAARVAREDVLAGLWRAEEAGRAPPAAHGPRPRLAMAWLRVTGGIERGAAGPVLTPRGRAEAEMVVRSHRLWEAWLGRHADVPLDHLHPPAEFVEHHLGAAMRRRIEAEVGRAAGDPHGRDIPPEA